MGPRLVLVETWDSKGLLVFVAFQFVGAEDEQKDGGQYDGEHGVGFQVEVVMDRRLVEFRRSGLL